MHGSICACRLWLLRLLDNEGDIELFGINGVLSGVLLVHPIPHDQYSRIHFSSGTSLCEISSEVACRLSA